MKTNYGQNGRLSVTFLCLIISQAVVGYGVGFAYQDTQRKIVSDDFTKNRQEGILSQPGNNPTKLPRPKPRRTYRLASNPLIKVQPSNNIAQLGITIWRLRVANPNDFGRRALLREKSQALSWKAERVESDAIFREGDHVRLSVESPRPGYLYVIDRDLYADGTTGGAMLIYPWSDADNRLRPGRLIDIPAQEDDPSYFAARLTTANQIGELLTFIVTSTPLGLPVGEKPFEIATGQLREWETRWAGLSERFEMEGGAGEPWTQEEQRAAVRNGTRQLTRDDPPPQTIYVLATKKMDTFLFNVKLSYAR
jgi:hypothetical protein